MLRSVFSSLDPPVLIALPRRAEKRRAVLERIAALFSPGRDYTEKEVNAVLAPVFSDITLLRRELIESGLLCRERDGSRYWRT
ncbi:MAG: DUF2087 domain-containing protein [Clostridia bacterium]|nr:DUF2087 domain-containing protein [Clostridia bacterium]